MVLKISGSKLLIGALAILLFISIGYLFLSREKTAYINMREVFNSFEYKKEAEAKYNKVFVLKKSILDSLRLNIEFLMGHEVLPTENESELNKKLELLKQEFNYKQGQFEEDNAAAVDKSNAEIWSQLNQYIGEFGKENGYDYVFGTNGEGNLMFAKEDKDITKKVLEYVNAKYQGNATK